MRIKPEVLFVGYIETACFSFAERGHGRVYLHPKFKEGEMVTTGVILKKGDGWFETESTVYVMVHVEEPKQVILTTLDGDDIPE